MEMSEISKTTRLPFAYLQFDSSLASAGLEGVQPFRCLLIGACADANAANKPVRLQNEADAKTAFGDDSMLHQMAKIYFKNSSIEVWGCSPGVLVGTGTDPTLSDDFLKSIKGMQFNVIASGYCSPAFLSALTKELESRAKATQGMEGLAVAVSDKDTVNAAKVVKDISSPYLSIVSLNGSTSKPHEIAAAISGVVATSAQEDAGRPFRTLELQGINPPTTEQLEGREARETALNSGVSTLYVDSNNAVKIERLITTYGKKGTDTSYLSPTTGFILSFLRWDFARYFGLKYPRHKLASDNYRGSGPVMTPSSARAECVCLFRKWEEQGLVQDADAFIKGLVCEISKSDPTRLNILLPTRLVSELDIIGAKLSFLF